MPNIKSAKKRMELSRTARQRNRESRSQIKTALRRVKEAATAAEAEPHKQTAISLIDRAATRRLIHPNKAARMKSQLERSVSAKG